MGPSFSSNDPRHRCEANASSIGQRLHRDAALGVGLARGYHVDNAQLCAWRSCASPHRSLATLGDHVMGVLRCSPKEQMPWVAARRIVAAMAHHEATGDGFSRGKYPGRSVGCDALPGDTSGALALCHPVRPAKRRVLPFHASGPRNRAAKEEIFQGERWWSSLWSHYRQSYHGARVTCVHKGAS